MTGKTSAIAILSGFWALVAGHPAPAAPTAGDPPREDLTAAEKATVRLFERASPACVHITSIDVARDFFTLNILSIPSGTGSGFVWDENGHVVTNYHVIRDADAARVTLADQTQWNAKLVGVEADKDIAVLKIDAPPEKLEPLTIGRSHNLLVGQNVYAIGNPFGLDQTLTTGVISGLGREIDSITRRPIRGVIQTDAAINPGNSGGPLLDSSGRLIGMNTAIFSPSGAYAGVGFAVPVDTIARAVPDLIQFGRVRKASPGFSILDDSVARRFRVRGVLVGEVFPQSAAAAAGIRPTRRNRFGGIELGDVVLEIAGHKILDANSYYDALEKLEIGSVADVTILRGATVQVVKLKLGESV